MKIRIVSDGMMCGTHVYDAETGAELKNITNIVVTIACDNHVVADVTFTNVELDLVTEVKPPVDKGIVYTC